MKNRQHAEDELTCGKRRGRQPSGLPNPVDLHVGARIRQRRMVLGLSQEDVGARTGVTFQQVTKYEHGHNRLGASRLYDFAQALEVPVGFFFEDMDAATAAASPRNLGPASAVVVPLSVIDGDQDNMFLMRNFSRISDPVLRQRVRDLIASLARHCSDEAAKELVA